MEDFPSLDPCTHGAGHFKTEYSGYLVPDEDTWRLRLLMKLLLHWREIDTCGEDVTTITEFIDPLCTSWGVEPPNYSNTFHFKEATISKPLWTVLYIKNLSTILAVYGPRNWTILAIYGPRNKLEPFWLFMAPEIANLWQFMAPETAPFWWFLLLDSRARNRQNGSVSGTINPPVYGYFWNLPAKFVSFHTCLSQYLQV